MWKRSQVLMFYDRAHRFTIKSMMTVTLALCAVSFLKVCNIIFKPLPVIQGPEDHEDYQKMLVYRQQQEEKEKLPA